MAPARNLGKRANTAIVERANAASHTLIEAASRKNKIQASELRYQKRIPKSTNNKAFQKALTKKKTKKLRVIERKTKKH